MQNPAGRRKMVKKDQIESCGITWLSNIFVGGSMTLYDHPTTTAGRLMRAEEVLAH